MNEGIAVFFFLYLLVTAGVSIPVAFALERKLKARFPNTRPYKWGYYIGCMELWCIPMALLCLFGASGKDAGWAVGASLFFWLHALCGWYVIQRRRWAWVVGTVIALNLFAWIINAIYASHRWHEFEVEAATSNSPRRFSAGVLIRLVLTVLLTNVITLINVTDGTSQWTPLPGWVLLWLACSLVIFFGIPAGLRFGWRFFLARLSEVSRAIRGGN